MPYIELKISRDTPEQQQRLVREQVDPVLREIHAAFMQEILRPDGNVVGCPRLIATGLLNVTDGVARRLYRTRHERKVGSVRKPPRTIEHNFKEMLIDRYPWDAEPAYDGKIEPEPAAKLLWNACRTPLTHNLGLSVEPRQVELGGMILAQSPRPDKELMTIENFEEWPREFAVPALYNCGVTTETTRQN